jgi:hypothetical protein
VVCCWQPEARSVSPLADLECVGCLLPLQVPDEVTQHSLRQSGYECNDVRT